MLLHFRSNQLDRNHTYNLFQGRGYQCRSHWGNIPHRKDIRFYRVDSIGQCMLWNQTDILCERRIGALEKTLTLCYKVWTFTTHLCKRTHTNVCAYKYNANTHVYTHTLDHTWIHLRIHTRVCTPAHTYTHARTEVHVHTHTHTHTHTSARTHTCIHTYTHDAHMRTHIHTLTHAYTHTRACTHTHTHTHTCTHTHTHTHKA